MKPHQFPEQPAHIWTHFYNLSQIPRPSGQEQAVRDSIIQLAQARQLTHQVDSTGNLLVWVPATAGCEQAPVVAVQNHLDMVTVKTGDKKHDFSRDPLTLQIEGPWLSADRTTLGADNGIGVAAAMAMMTDPTLVHPALELLFTVEEETGLHGALGFDTGMLSAQRMINLDTEDWGEIYLGCAGGYGYEAHRHLHLKLPTPGLKAWTVHLKGLTGGHSGMQIHEQLGNANKLLIELLVDACDLTWQLSTLRGGVAHNVIAREASAVIMLDERQLERWHAKLAAARARWLSYLPTVDHQLEWVFCAIAVDQPLVLGQADTEGVLDLMSILPHGPQSYSLQQPADLVDLSCNLALVNISNGELRLQTSLRFFNEQQTVALKQTIESVFRSFDLVYDKILDYPGWNPNFDSPLVARTQQLAELLTGQPVALKAIHAGLECGILVSKKPGMDVVSFGPTIKGAHSPSERLLIETVAPFWQLVVRLLAELAADRG
ncbi:beta-Ala-His dipeptidase [Reinekea sp.]|jgi:dipeptidase D|uniref:beta-Ala-His dipeptidase n=1 Tax=Reinekea sp. TaxID=1970455 RepID=UPI002A840913|nr:beta-Ala-His dipeptidase [Reinekea sp.]